MRREKPTNSESLLTKTEVEEANKAVAKVLEPTSKTSALRGNYNSYTSVQRGEIGKYSVENGVTSAAKHFSLKWNVNINESTARRLKAEYLEKLNEALKSKPGESVTVDSLETKQKGRPLLLGEELDAAVQEYVSSFRIAGGVVNTVVVRAAAEGIISARDITKLTSHGGRINITKSWAMSLLNRMGYVKRKASTSGKIPQLQYVELREVFLADIAAEMVMKDIPREMIFNWDQIGLSIIPTGSWTMEREGAKVVSIAHVDDKRQITAVLAVTATGEYLAP